MTGACCGDSLEHMFVFHNYSEEALLAHIAGLDTKISRLQAERVAAVGALDCLRAPSGHGNGVREGLLAQETGMARKEAKELSDAAKALEGLPEISEAFESGEITWGVARELVKFATPERDGDLADEAKSWSADQAATIARKERAISAEEARKSHEERSLKWFYDSDKRHINIRGVFPAADGEIIVGAISKAARTSYNRSAPVGFPARCADALLEMAAGFVTDSSDAARIDVVLVAEVSEITSGGSAIEIGEGFCSTDVAKAIMCDSAIQLVLKDPDGQIKALGSRSRCVPEKLRRLVKARDKTCRFPGCDRTKFAEIHHIVHVADGGKTVLENLTMICYAHHHLIHEGGWHLEGVAPLGLRFISPEGRIYDEATRAA